MNRQAATSSMIASFGYDTGQSILEIEFRSGRTYRYFDVPKFLYRGLEVAASKGEYFLRRIDNRFRFEELR